MKRRQGRLEIEYPQPLLEPVLRRTLGSRRSADKMKALEIKLRAGMDAKGVGYKAQEEIILAISSVALYGFPKFHAASYDCKTLQAQGANQD